MTVGEAVKYLLTQDLNAHIFNTEFKDVCFYTYSIEEEGIHGVIVDEEVKGL